MSASDYVLDSANECDRLERQAALDGLGRHLRHLPSLDRARLLDAGSGSGALARTIASHHPGWQVVGVDLNANYVAYAQRHADAAALDNLSFEQGDLQALQFAPDSFDIVWTRFVLYFLPNPETALAEFDRVLRPGGTLIVSLHNWSTLINYPEDPDLKARQTRVFGSIADMHLAQKLPSMLSAAGFEGISVDIQLDPIYSAIGTIGTEARRNFHEVFGAGIERVALVLGSQAEAERFIADSLAYLDRADTYTYSLLWTIRCRK